MRLAGTNPARGRGSLAAAAADWRGVCYSLSLIGPRGRYGEKAMTIWEFLILLLVAGVCGAVGQAITGGWRGGILVSIALGFIGALLGLWLARLMRLPELFNLQIGDTSFPIIWSI